MGHQMPRFELEDHFARWKLACEHNITSSDVEGLSLCELLDLMDAETTELWTTMLLGYGPTRGHPTLRSQIASTYTQVEPDGVHVFSGATEAVFAAMHVLLEEGDHAVVITPIYQLLSGLPATVGADVTQVALQYDNDWELDLSAVRAAITPRTTLIVANFPNNPTGSLPAADTFRALADLADEAGARLLSDELYRGVEAPQEARLPAGADFGKHVLSVGGVSKVYGLAGLRVGWVASQDTKVLDRLRTFRYWSSLSNSVPSEILALGALRASEQLLDRSRSIVTKNTDLLADVIARHPEKLGWVRPHGGTTAYPQLLIGQADALARRLAEEFSVFVAPSSVLLTGGEHLRIGLGRQGLAQGLHQLDVALT